MKPLILVLAFVLQANPNDAKKLPEAVQPLLGAWKQEGGDKIVFRLFEPERMVGALDGTMYFHRIGYEPTHGGEVRVLSLFRGERTHQFTVKLQGDRLTMKLKSGDRTFIRLKQTPEELVVRPLPLGEVKALPRERVNEIRRELGKREKRSLKLREELTQDAPEKARELLTTDKDNAEYLSKVICEVGWIDSKRFGTTGLQSAYHICFWALRGHRLLLTGTLEIEKEVKKSNFDAESWALLHDRYRRATGQREKFGSQIYPNAKGEACLGPLEDRKRVDEFRKAYGLPTLAEYLQRYKDEGTTVQVVDED